MKDIHAILKQYWGYTSFRPMQEDIITAVLQKKDVLALLPTGAGKSLCFQVPVMAMEGICIVISPLIALIKDQVERLQQHGIPALAVFSGMTFLEVKNTLQNAAFGNYKFLYLSPERLETKLFLEYLPALKPCLIAVDEAHCISQWGYDFRPPYLRIANLKAELPGVPIIALTASATLTVQEDIREKLLFGKQAIVFQQSFKRPNLSYSIFSPPAKETKLLEVLKNVPGSAIVYCKSRRHTQVVAELLQLKDINADYYHAGLAAEQRTNKQDAWINNKTRVMVCTNAFGMGIDKADVRVVIHYDVPDCLEHYYQESGRAGRDGKRAYAVLLQHPSEVKDMLQLAATRYPSAAELKNIYSAIMNHLQVPAGIGEGNSYDFDMALFAQYFKLNILQATYGIKALAQQDVLSFNEVFFRPSRVSFTTSKNDLAEFEQQHPELEPFIKALLRSYEGIFDYTSTVYEGILARFIRTSKDNVIEALKDLHRHGVIQYEIASDKPQVYLLKNRMYSDDFKIDAAILKERKSAYEKRLHALEDYINDEDNCRSQLLAAYFNAPFKERCKICDNCIAYAQTNLSADAFEKLYQQIIDFTSNGAIAVQTLVKQLPTSSEHHIWEAIHFLQAEELIIQDPPGFIKAGAKKKGPR